VTDGSRTPLTEAAAPPPLPDGDGTYRICCVCTGNICRSPMAEVILGAGLDRAGLAGRVVVDSAGTSKEEAGRPIHPGTQRTLHRHGLAAVHHRARLFEPTWVTAYDLLLAMDSGHRRVLRRYATRHGADPSRVVLVGDLDPAGSSGDVPDPWGYPDEVFQDVYAQLTPALDALVAALPDLLG
jgi:protein-tyrosine phosphatase